MDNSQSPPANPRPIIGLVTYSALPDLHEGDWPLRDALLTRGFAVRAVAWDDLAVDWSSLDLCVIRSTWDYHHRLDEFLAWAERASAQTRLWNPLDVLRWNTHKTYLRDLEQRGVPIVPTEWLDRGPKVDLALLMRERGWQRAVVKPSVSASAHATVLVTADTLAEGQAHLDALLTHSDAMVQPFIASVETYRERSLLFIDGELTHAVSRPPQLRTDSDLALGDSDREDYGLVTPTDDEVSLALSALTAARCNTLYARVDIVRSDHGESRLIELELVEPSLFLDLSPLAVERLAAGIAARCA